MERPLEDISGVLSTLLSSDSERVVKEVEAVYSKDAVLEDPVMVWKGRSRVKQVWNTWSHMHRKFSNHKVVDACFNKEQTRMYVDLEYKSQPLVYPTVQPQRTLLLLDVEKTQKQGGGYTWHIKRHESLVQPPALLRGVIPEPLGGLVSAVLELLQAVVGFLTVRLFSQVAIIAAKIASKMPFRRKTREPTFTGPLRIVENDMQPFLEALLSSHTDHVAAVVDRCFTKDGAFVHPVIQLSGKSNVKALYTTWSRLNWSFKDHQVHDVAFSSSGRRAYVEMSYGVHPLIGFGKFSARIVAVLDLEPSAGHEETKDEKGHGGWLIKRQEDFVQPRMIVRMLLPGWYGRLYKPVAWIVGVVAGPLLIYFLGPAIIRISNTVKTKWLP